MPIYLFKVVNKNQQGQAVQVPVGVRSGFVVTFPGNLEQCKYWLRANHVGSPGIKYWGVELPSNLRDPEILALEINLGVVLPPGQPQVSAAHVNGGQSVGAPVGNVAGNLPTGLQDSSGFQKLGDEVLSGVGDTLFGDQGDGTITDLYGGGHFEAPRQL
jgi:hypothetical protein